MQINETHAFRKVGTCSRNRAPEARRNGRILTQALLVIATILATAQPTLAARKAPPKPAQSAEQPAAPRKACRHKVIKTVTEKYIELRRRERCF